METERLMRQEIERLEGLLDAGVKRALKELADEDEAEADEAEEGQGVLTDTEKRVQACWEKNEASRKHARLKSPAILASKDRLRRRRVRKGEARVAKCPDGSSHEFNHVTFRCERCGRSREAAVNAGLKPSGAAALTYPHPIGTR